MLNITGTASLGGTLDVDLIEGFQPEPGQSFDVMTFGSCIDEFDQYSGLDLGNGLWLEPRFTEHSLTLITMVPEPSEFVMLAGLAAASFLLYGWRRRKGTARRPGQRVEQSTSH